MPLHWTVDSRDKLITAVGDGELGRADFESYFQMVSGANIVSWRQLIDAGAAQPTISFDDVNLLGAVIRSAHTVQVAGPLAFVTPEIESEMLNRLLGFLAAAKRPMRIFYDPKKARRWLDSCAIRASI